MHKLQWFVFKKMKKNLVPANFREVKETEKCSKHGKSFF